MKVITRKNKLVLAELNPNAQYIMLVNPANTRMETLGNLQVNSKVNIQIVIVENVNEAIKFVEIPR